MLTGCSQESVSVEKHDFNDKVDMTENELELMKGAYINEDNIENGKLYDYQYRNLQYIRDANSYMVDKYGRDDFIFESFEPLTTDNKRCELRFCKDNEYYSVYVDETGDITDNFYSYYITNSYNKEIENLISQSLWVSCKVSTTFSFPYGNDIDGDLSVDEIFELGDKLGRDTRIYSDTPIEQDNLENLVLKNNLYGSYKVFLVADIDDYSSVDELDENLGKNYIDKYTFSFWEIEDEE